MSASKRPSTSSLRRFITSRPFVTVAELRRRFALEDAEGMVRLAHDGTVAWIGLPEREAGKLQDLWDRGEVGVELSVEVRAPVVVGVYPMRIARYIIEGATNGNGHAPAGTHARHGGANGAQAGANGTHARHAGANGAHAGGNGTPAGGKGSRLRGRHRPPRPMHGAPGYGDTPRQA